MNSSHRCLLYMAACFLGAAASNAEDFQVNTYTTGVQRQPSVSIGDNEDFVVVWTSDGSVGGDFDRESIQGQRYNSDGSPAGEQFQVNTWTTDAQTDPSVATGPDGDFVVVWTSNDDGHGIRGQRYASDGSTVGGEFQVNTDPAIVYATPAVASSTNGSFVVVWWANDSAGDDQSSTNIQGRHFAADGLPLGHQFQVNTYTTYVQRDPTVALDAEGNFVVVWESDDSVVPLQTTIRGQRYFSDGSPAGEEFLIGSSAEETAVRYRPVVASDAEGDFVVVWEVATEDFDEVKAQRFASDGSPMGEEFHVSSDPARFLVPSVASSAAGDFVIVWDQGLATAIMGRRYASNGSEITNTFRVNTNSIGAHFRPSVSANSAGEFLVAWRGRMTGGNDPDDSIERSGFLLAGPIFDDGFESGDTSAWSNSLP